MAAQQISDRYSPYKRGKLTEPEGFGHTGNASKIALLAILQELEHLGVAFVSLTEALELSKPGRPRQRPGMPNVASCSSGGVHPLGHGPDLVNWRPWNAHLLFAGDMA